MGKQPVRTSTLWKMQRLKFNDLPPEAIRGAPQCDSYEYADESIEISPSSFHQAVHPAVLEYSIRVKVFSSDVSNVLLFRRFINEKLYCHRRVHEYMYARVTI